MLKQNCGVREGGGGGWVIMSFWDTLGASVPEDFFQRMFASMTNYKISGCAPGAGILRA